MSRGRSGIGRGYISAVSSLSSAISGRIFMIFWAVCLGMDTARSGSHAAWITLFSGIYSSICLDSPGAYGTPFCLDSRRCILVNGRCAPWGDFGFTVFASIFRRNGKALWYAWTFGAEFFFFTARYCDIYLLYRTRICLYRKYSLCLDGAEWNGSFNTSVSLSIFRALGGCDDMYHCLVESPFLSVFFEGIYAVFFSVTHSRGRISYDF